MTPPLTGEDGNVPPIGPDYNSPFQNDGQPAPICKGGCHAPAPDANWGLSAFSQFSGHSSFLQPSGGHSPKLFGDKKFLADWIKKAPKKAAAPVVPTPPPPPPVDVKLLLAEAEKLEKLGDATASPGEKISAYRDAAKIYRLAQDTAGNRRALGSLRKVYETEKNEAGLTEVDAELAFTDGKFEEALKGFRALETLFAEPSLKIGSEEREAALFEINLKISVTLQGLAARESKAGKWDEAIAALEEALVRTPSPYLSEKVLQLWNVSGKANLAAIKREADEDILRQAESIAKLWDYKNGSVCNNGCHAPAKDPFATSPWQVVSSLTGLRSFDYLNGAETDPLEVPAEGGHRTLTHSGSYKIYSKLDPDQQVQLQDKEAALIARHEKSEKDQAEIRAHLAWIVRLGYAEAGATKDTPVTLRRIGQVLAENGDRESAITLYRKAIAATPAPADAGKPLEAAKAELSLAEVSHELAALYLQTGRYQEAAELLDSVDEGIQNADVSAAPLNLMGGNAAMTAKETLHLQNRFMKAEVLLAKANTQEEQKEAIDLLRSLAANPPIDIWNAEPGDPQYALLGRIQLRLGQVLLGQDPKSSDAQYYLKKVIEDFASDAPGDVYLRSEAKLAMGLGLLQAPGQTMKGLTLLREVQSDCPGSEADQTIRRSPTLASLRGEDGMIKEDINEADLGEALKVALDRSSEGPGWRKGAFAGAGAIVAAVIFWEVSIPVLIIGGGVGYFAEKGVSVIEHRGDILDAYQSGLSNVDGSRNLQNIFMLGLDVAMLVTAGAGGAIARQGVRYGMSWGANRLAAYGAETAFGTAALRTLAPIGKGLMYVVPAAADSTVAYTIYKGERSLVLGEKFAWDPKEAFLMFAMCEAFAFARFSGTAAKFATKPAFNNGVQAVLKEGEVIGFKEAGGKVMNPVLKDGALAHYADAAGNKYFPIMQNGKVMGLTNTAGKVVVWTNDLLLGATTYYAMLLGAEALNPGSVPGGIPDYDAFLAEQVKTLGALHFGGKAVRAVGQGGMEKALARMDRKSNEWLKQAKETLDRADPGDGGFPGWGPQLAFEGIPAGVFPESKLPKYLQDAGVMFRKRTGNSAAPASGPGSGKPGKGTGEETPKFDWSKSPLSKDKIQAVTSAETLDPKTLIDLLKQDPHLAAQFPKDVGVREKLTLEAHTRMVLAQFEHYYGGKDLPGGVKKDLFRLILALHDAGKPLAVEAGNKAEQHKHTVAILEGALKKWGYGQKDIDLAVALVSSDPIGNYMKRGGEQAAAKEIAAMAKKAGMPVAEFFELLTAYYMVDAGSYTSDAGLRGKGLDSVFVFDRAGRKISFSAGYEPAFKILGEAVEAAAKAEAAGPVFKIEGVHWRKGLRIAWEKGIPIRGGENFEKIEVYEAPPKKSDAAPMSKSVADTFDKLGKHFATYRTGSRLRRRLQVLQDTYLASPEATRAKIERKLEEILQEAELTGEPLKSKVYPRFRDLLDNLISNYGRKIGEVEIKLDTDPANGSDKPAFEVPGAYSHYTDRESIKKILKSGKILLSAPLDGRQRKIYISPIDMPPSQVERDIFIGNDAYKGKGNYVIGFDLAPHISLERGMTIARDARGLPIYEYFAVQNLEIGKDIFIRYAGENPLVEAEF